MSLENSWLFPAIESIHLIGMAAFMGTVVLADLRTLGLEIPDSSPLRRWTLAGLIAIVLTGAVLFLSDTSRYLRNPAFNVKTALFLLALTAHFTLRRSGTRFAAGLSLALWTLVVLAGRAIADFDV